MQVKFRHTEMVDTRIDIKRGHDVKADVFHVCVY